MKTTFLSVIFGLLFVSCSRDNDGVVNNSKRGIEEKVLVTKVNSDRGSRGKGVITYSYDGDKLKYIEGKGDNGYSFKTTYQYDGDLIKLYSDVDSNGNTREVVYTYNSNKQLEKSVSTDKAVSLGFQVTTQTKSYTYKDNGMIEVNIELHRRADNGNEQKISRSYTYTMVDGLITKLEGKYVDGKDYTQYFEYDTKNSPLVNVRGFLDLAIDFFDDGMDNVVWGLKNNIKTITIPLEQNKEYKQSIEYEYTSHNYPAKITSQRAGVTETFVLTYNR